MLDDLSRGWVKLPRAIWDSPIASKKDYLLVWLYIYSNVNHKEHTFIFNNKNITVKKGQGIFSQKGIAEKLDINISTVHRILKYLENENQIEKQTTTKFTLLTAINYESLNQNENQNGKQTKNKLKQTRMKRMKRKKKDINYKKPNSKSVKSSQLQLAQPPQEVKKKDSPLSKKFTRFIEMFNDICNKNFKGDKASKRNFKARIKEGYTLEDFEKAIKNASVNEWLSKNSRYLTPEYITRDTKLEQWINAKPKENKSKMADPGWAWDGEDN